jgi:hypothetical protein
MSRRAAPVSQWGEVLAQYPEVVKARIDSLQTGDLVLTSTRVGSWVGNTVQVLTDSTWNHVAVVVRGFKTEDKEDDTHPTGWCHIKKAYTPRTPFHFKVDNTGTPHLFEASYQGVHIYDSVFERLFEDPAYEECAPPSLLPPISANRRHRCRGRYSTIAVRALQGVERTPTYMRRLEEWIAKTRGTAFEAEAQLHDLFSDAAGGTDTAHSTFSAVCRHVGPTRAPAILCTDALRGARHRDAQDARPGLAALRGRHRPAVRLCGWPARHHEAARRKLWADGDRQGR